MISKPKTKTTTDHIFIDGTPVGMYYAPMDTWLLDALQSPALLAFVTLPEKYTWLAHGEFKLAMRGKAHEVFAQRFAEAVRGDHDQ